MCDGARVAGGDEGDGLGMRGHGSLGALVVQKSEEVCRERAHCALGKEKDSEDRTSPPRAQAARSPPARRLSLPPAPHRRRQSCRLPAGPWERRHAS